LPAIDENVIRGALCQEALNQSTRAHVAARNNAVALSLNRSKQKSGAASMTIAYDDREPSPPIPARHNPARPAEEEAAKRDEPLFSGLDVAGLIAIVVMALGPLTAYTVGA